MGVGQKVQSAVHRSDGSPGPGARGVHGAMPADREQPAAEVFLTAGEPVQVPDDLKPGLARHVIRIIAADNPEEPQQSRLERAPELKEPGLVTPARPGQGIVEHASFTCHRASKGRIPAGIPTACLPTGVPAERLSCENYEAVAGEIVSVRLTDLAKFRVPRKTSRKVAAFL